jgi:hypothetical protein
MSSTTLIFPAAEEYESTHPYELNRIALVQYLTSIFRLNDKLPDSEWHVELENDQMWIFIDLPNGLAQSVSLQTRSYRDDLPERFPVVVFLAILLCLQGFDTNAELAIITPDEAEALFNADTTMRELHQICEASA